MQGTSVTYTKETSSDGLMYTLDLIRWFIVYIIVLIIVSDKWSPALQIRTVLLSIQALLSAPNPDDPLANDVAEQWKLNESQAIETGNIISSHLSGL